MGYSRMDIFQKCEAGLSNIKMFYKQPFINYNGRTTDTNELYTEVVAEFLSQNLDQFVAGFPVITRNQKRLYFKPLFWSWHPTCEIHTPR